MSENPNPQDLGEIVESIWEVFLADGGPIRHAERTEFEPAMTASISISGAWNGLVAIGFSAQAARWSAAHMLGIPLEDLRDADVVDAVGELVNVIGGNVKGIVDAPTDLSLPVVARGRSLSEQSSRAGEVIELHFSWADEPVSVQVIPMAGVQAPSAAAAAHSAR
ncbi:MAG: chemotaxis protein CheX [Actinomycetota bacterium]|nr:chemotaxis protein CheX [Actinomycetota bacterium]